MYLGLQQVVVNGRALFLFLRLQSLLLRRFRRFQRRFNFYNFILRGAAHVRLPHRGRLKVRDVPLQLLYSRKKRTQSLCRGRFRGRARHRPSLGAFRVVLRDARACLRRK